LIALPLSGVAQTSATRPDLIGAQRYIVRLKDGVHARGEAEPLT